MYIYQGIIQPRFDYALTIWGFTSQYNLSKVQRLQNRAARIITGEFDYIHVRGIDIVKNLKWMNVIQRRDYFVALSMFKCIHGMSPSYLSDCITMYNEIAVRDTGAFTSSYLVSVPHAPLLFSRILSRIGALLYGMHCLNMLESTIIYIRLRKLYEHMTL